MGDASYLVDSNVLLRWVQPAAAGYSLARAAVNQLRDEGCSLYFTSQNLGEFWNVLTRPTGANGFGLTPQEADRSAQEIEERLQLLPDSIEVHREWRRLLVDHAISGVQVHDARLAAAMRVHGLGYILTFNARDFVRFPGIHAVPPSDLATGPLP